MDAGAAHRLFRLLGTDRCDFLYAGAFHDANTASLIALGEAIADACGRGRALRQRLAFVMVEAYQNIVRHRSAAQALGGAHAFFVVRSDAEGDTVLTVNAIDGGEADDLDAALQRLNRSAPAQLKELFLARLRDESRTIRGGAGLGLIEMARRSGQPMAHRLLPLDAGHRLFALSVRVGAVGPKESIDELLRIQEQATAMRLLMACRCGSSAAAQEAMLRAMERELADDPARSSRVSRAYLAVSSWMHDEGRAGDALSLLAHSSAGLEMRVVWHTEEEAIKTVGARVDSVNGLSPFERDRHYRNALLGRTQGAEGPAAGLLELAQLQQGPLLLEWDDGVASLKVRL